MTNPDELLRRHKAALPSWTPLYYEQPLELARGEGFRVWDSEGNEYLDFFGGIVTTISGHAVPEITEAIKSQVDKIFHTSTLYLIENQVKLAEKLIDLAPISGEKKAFFVGSGSEANEAALLFATRYRNSSEIIALRSSYHGSTFMTMGITGQSTWSPTSRSALDVAYARNPYKLRCPLCRDEGRCNLLCADDVRAVVEEETTGNVAAFHRRAHPGRRGLRRGAARLLRAGKGDPGRDGDTPDLRRGPDGLRAHGRALLGHRRLRRGAGHDRDGQGPRQRPRHRRRRRQGRGDRVRRPEPPPLHLRREPDLDGGRPGEHELHPGQRPPDQRPRGRHPPQGPPPRRWPRTTRSSPRSAGGA